MEFLPAIKENFNDDRNTVKKAISWALREMGKRSIRMNKIIGELAIELKTSKLKPVRWIASDVIRDISRESVKERLQKRALKSN